MKRALRYFLLVDSIVLVFFILGVVLGIGIGRFQWFPYSYASKIYSRVKVYLSAENSFDPRRANFEFAFGPPIVSGDLIYPEMRSDSDIFAKNREIFVPINAFQNAFENINIAESRMFFINGGTVQLLEVKFYLEGKQYTATAYKSKDCKTNIRATLIIPGSGINQSTKIINMDKDSYHYGVTEIFGDACQFVYIKPNEDALAWPFGGKKLDGTLIFNWHINSGGSYSLSYLVQTIAIAKFLKTTFTKLTVAGISQGGAATLLNALQTKPDYALVISGYNSSLAEHEWSGFDQLVIPGMNVHLTPAAIMQRIRNSHTQYLFTWGIKEIGAYKAEAINSRFCQLKNDGVYNISCISHQGGHEVPVSEIRQWLAEKEF